MQKAEARSATRPVSHVDAAPPPSGELLYLSRSEVAALLPPVADQLELVERTYRAVGAGRIELPPKPGVHPRPDAFIHAMPAYLLDDDIVAIKCVSGYPENKELGLPYISGVIVVNDAGTGLPIAVMDAAEITAARTAAATGVCIRHFASTGWRRAAILGCGEQGVFHARLLAALEPDATIAVWDPDRARAEAMPGRVEVVAGPREAVAGADVVVTAGPIVAEPASPLTREWLGERWLALTIDFDFYFSPEAIAGAGAFYVDDVAQFDYYRRRGHFRGWRDPDCSVGEALGGSRDFGRVACVNLGIGALDTAFADSVLRRAREDGVGTQLPR